MRRFYAPPENFKGENILLNAEETRHLRDVLRLRIGEKVNVFDGTGNEFLCTIEQIGKSETDLQILEKVLPASPESDLDLTLGVALLKGEKFDLVIQKACELGVTRIVPLKTKRADVKIKDEKEASKKIERWRKIALEAAKQSGRSKILIVEEITDFENFSSKYSDTKIFFSERAGASFTEFVEQNSNIESVSAIVGSEGGWEDLEIEFAGRNGFQIITLGGRILRAETAAIAVSALLQNRFGDLR